jgi:CDGSH-type Zn-finger protein
MPQPLIPLRAPLVIDTAPGSYAWCTCGRSAGQPFCDGAHGETGFTPQTVSVEAQRRLAWCACKHTKTPPFCDGSHRQLPAD